MFAFAASVVPGLASDSTSFLISTPSGTREYIVRWTPSRHGCNVSVLRSFADGGDNDRVEIVIEMSRGSSQDFREGGNPGEHGNVAVTVRCVSRGKVAVRTTRLPVPERSPAPEATVVEEEEE